MNEQIADSLCELIGGTPLVRLGRFGKGLPGEIVGKLELRNPLASVKDRIGLAMIEQAEKDGLIRPGGTVIRSSWPHNVSFRPRSSTLVRHRMSPGTAAFVSVWSSPMGR